MAAHFAEIAVIANMIADSILVEVAVDLSLPGEFFGNPEGLENRGGVRFAAAEIVDLADARSSDESGHETRDIERVNVVANLFSFVSENFVLTTLQIAFHEVAEETMELDSRVIRAGETTSAETASRQIEIATVLLNHDVGGDLGGAKERML